MILRAAMILTMLMGLLGFGAVGWLLLKPAAPAAPVVAEPPPPIETHRVIVASAALRAGTLIKPEDLTAKEMTERPAGSIDDSVQARTEIMGSMLRRSLMPGEVLSALDFMRPGDHGFLAAVLEPGLRAASISVDSVSGSAGLIWPGDHVDLILTQSIDEQGTPAARKIAAETILQDVRVIAIDQLLVHGVAPSEPGAPAHTVTLEVTPEQAEKVAVATRLGKLSLSVRSPDRDAPTSPPPTTWSGDVSAALGSPAPHQSGAVLHVYGGAGDGKEFRF